MAPAAHAGHPDTVTLGRSVGSTVKGLVELVVDLAGFKGEVRGVRTKPDGQPRRKLNVERAAKEFGFRSTTAFKDGLRETIRWYEEARTGSRP